ncbi:MAG: acyl carrier protein [Oscillospiraceae bacterium]|jgi:acyl carrier protein|nr:acyl carrier protein [Oscillospiraceae bacterium]
MKNDLRATVLGLLAEHTNLDPITMESDFVKDFGLSSLEIAELICSIEDDLDVEISESALTHIKTVGDLCKYIDAM